MKGVSVIVCCYNSADRLPKTLGYLAQQVVPDSEQWEVVVVDNASTDNTATVAKEVWARYYVKDVQFKVVYQPKPGLTYAREMGINASKYNVLIFCDDDNWLHKDYIANAYVIMNSNEKIGALGGRGEAIADAMLPEWFDKYRFSYASYPQAQNDGELLEPTAALYGAGLVVRKEVLTKLKATNYQPVLSDRIGQSLSSGGDIELCYVIKMLGYKLWYSEKLSFEHYMPSERLTLDYLLKLNRSLSYCSAHLNVYRYILSDKKVNNWVWFKDLVYKIFLLGKSFLRIVSLRRNKFEHELDFDFSYYSFLGVFHQIGYSSHYQKKLLKLT